MKAMKRYLCVALALVTALCAFTGCGDKKGGGDSPDPNNTAEPTGFVYVPEYVTVQGEFKNNLSYNSTYANGYIYAPSYEMIEDRTPEGVTPEYEGEYWVYGYVIYKIALDGSCEKIGYTPMELPEGAEGSTNINGMDIAEDGSMCLLERLYTYSVNIPEGIEVEEYSEEYWNYYESREDYYLRFLDADGAEISSILINDLSDGEDYFYVNSFSRDKDGNVYICSDRKLYVLDGEGNLQFDVGTDSGWIEKVMQLDDGRVVCGYYGDEGPQLSVVDFDARGFGESIKTSIDMYSLIQGGGDYDFYYTSGVNFFGYNLDTDESEKVLNWLNCDVDTSNTGGVLVLDDGRIVTISSEWNDNYEYCTNEIIIISRQPAASVPQKTIITLAAQYINWNTRSAIIEFNRNNNEYRIEVMDYSEYNTEEDYSAGLTKLTAEILSGQVPDILDMNGMPADRFAARGLLEDLYPYLDNDPGLSRDDIMPNVLAAVENDGKLYQTVSDFYVNTVVGAKSVVGDKPGWTYDDLKAALATMPEGCDVFDRYTTRDNILSYCMALDGDSYVNWNTGECSFDSEGFVKMLEFVNSFPSEFDWENYNWTEEDNTDTRISSGRQMLMNTSVSDFMDFMMYDAMFGGEANFVGFPTENGTGNMIYFASSGYAMSSKCANKEGAWQFLRQFFTEEYQTRNTWAFPSNKAGFDKKLEDAMTPEYETDADGNYVLDEDGNRIEVSYGGWSWGGIMIEYRAITQEEADRIVELINTTTKSYKSDESILDIVKEEAAPFFEGQKSAGDVAKLVQSKATLYVNEQR